MSGIELTAIISFALLGSIGHCIGMCGGFIVTYTTAKIHPQMSKTAQLFNHFLYNSGRILSYALLGALFGFFGSLWDVTPLSRALLYLVAGVLMVLMGLSFAGKLKFLNSIEYPLTKHAWFKRMFTMQLKSQNRSSFFFLGALNGLFPCGLVYTMLVTAAVTESAMYGALVMLIFGAATVPVLFSFAYVVGLFSQSRFREIAVQLAAVTVILYGGYTLYKAYHQYELWQSPALNNGMSPECH